jgi:hypothetical protein
MVLLTPLAVVLAAHIEQFTAAGTIATRGCAGFEYFTIDGESFLASKYLYTTACRIPRTQLLHCAGPPSPPCALSLQLSVPTRSTLPCKAANQPHSAL